MRVLQLCSFTALTENSECWDTKNGKDVMTLPDDYGKNFDYIISAPPCNQFTMANTRNWEKYPEMYINIARKCLRISEESGKPWIIENVPGRITKLIPELNKYRQGVWKNTTDTKKHLLFSNQLIILYDVNQKKLKAINLLSGKKVREKWSKEFQEFLINQINKHGNEKINT